VLGIETSSRRGSVALVEGERLVCELEHERENAHGESIQPLIEQALASAGWASNSLDRIGVGVGPGSFTGLRVGIALAQGLSEGLEIPLVGIGSLAAMAMAVPASEDGVRCAVVDARHGELFSALYAAAGEELVAPWLADAAGIEGRLPPSPEPVIFVGLVAPVITRPGARRFVSREADLPHARFTAFAAVSAMVPASVLPLYVRQVVAVRPNLPRNPLEAPDRLRG